MTTFQRAAHLAACVAVWLLCLPPSLRAQAPAQSQEPPASEWQYGGFLDAGHLSDSNAPVNHLFRNRGTTPRVDELDVNMAGAYLRKTSSESSRVGVELTVHGGQDAQTFGFSATAPNMGGVEQLRYIGPTDVSYLAPIGHGLTLQGGIFSSLIGYDSLYAKDNFNYTRPWGADYTPYLMLGVNAAYPVTPRLTATAFVVNGYWHLAHANGVPSVGGQLAYKANDHVTVKETVLDGPHQSDTSLDFWRFLSDTIVDRKIDRLTTAFEYQVAGERVADTGSRALWMSAQLPVHWVVRGPLSVTARPELCWDRDGRWTGFPQSVKALTTTFEYRIPYRRAQGIVRLEYRVDDSRGSGGGFFDDGTALGGPTLTPTQHLFGVGLILTFDGTFRQ